MFALALTLILSAGPKAPVSAGGTQLVLDVKPATVVIFLDDKKLGTASKVWTVSVKPGEHKVKLVSRISSQEDFVSLKKGEKKIWKFDMGDSGEKSTAPDGKESPTPTLDSSAPSDDAK